MSRGNRRAAIVLDDRDRRLFLAEYARAVRKAGWNSLGYALLGNHFHLVVETPEPNLGRGMGTFLSRFVQQTNRRYGIDGRAFQSRFKSRPVTNDEYFACLLRYVALNPVNAGLCADPAEWPWSSHASVLARRSSPLLNVQRVEELLEVWGGRAERRYRTLLEPDGRWGPWSDATDPTPPRRPLSSIFATYARDNAMFRARWEDGYTLAEIAAFAGVSQATVSRRTCRARKGPGPFLAAQ